MIFQTAFIALGSNLGDRFRYVQEAVFMLNEMPFCQVLACSPVYESAALTLSPNEDAPAFLNAVAQIRTALSPLELLDICQAIEQENGRIRGKKWAARTLDLDILLLGHEMCNLPNLTLPHPEMVNRRFVLKPLSDLAPNLEVQFPTSGKIRIAELLAQCTDYTPLMATTFILRTERY